MKILIIIQARLTSTRFPRKVLETVGGKTLIARICAAARDARVGKVVVVWAHKFPHLDENNVLGRYQEVTKKYNPDYVIRLTSDCPLMTPEHILQSVDRFFSSNSSYYCNRNDGALDGFDVQIFDASLLFNPDATDREHVIKPPLKLSVDTREDLERVRAYYAQQ